MGRLFVARLRRRRLNVRWFILGITKRIIALRFVRKGRKSQEADSVGEKFSAIMEETVIKEATRGIVAQT
jgi:hypothetical protein